MQGLPPLEEPQVQSENQNPNVMSQPNPNNPMSNANLPTIPGGQPGGPANASAPLQPKVEPMDQAETDPNANKDQGSEQKPAETKMEVDPAVKEEKMDVDETGAEKEKEVEKKEVDSKPRIMISGMENNQRKQLIEIIKRLEGVFTETPSECTHLIMPKLSRTNNFLLCISTVKFVLRPQWIQESDTQVSIQSITLDH